jgi:hypothetical protein
MHTQAIHALSYASVQSWNTTAAMVQNIVPEMTADKIIAATDTNLK